MFERRAVPYSPPEVLRHGEHPGCHVDGDEDPAQQHQDEDGVHLEGGDPDARGCPGPRQPDEVPRADVGGEQRGAHLEHAGIRVPQYDTLGYAATMTVKLSSIKTV